MFCLLWIIHSKQKLRDEKIGTLNKKKTTKRNKTAPEKLKQQTTQAKEKIKEKKALTISYVEVKNQKGKIWEISVSHNGWLASIYSAFVECTTKKNVSS